MNSPLIKRIWGLREYYGQRLAWKAGDLTGDEPHGKLEGQFSVSLDFNVDSNVFADYERNPFRTVARYVDHSLSIMFWRWGIWAAVRGRQVRL